MKEFIEMLKKIKPNVDFENEEALVDDGILESLDKCVNTVSYHVLYCLLPSY